MIDTIAAVIFAGCCVALCVTMFLRAVDMTRASWLPSRLVVIAGVAVAVYGLYAVLALGYRPGWPSAAVAVALVALVSTAHIGGTSIDLEDAARGSRL